MYPRSTRNVRGNGAMKKGHRTNGEMWINIRRSYAGFSRGAYFNENMTVGELVDEAARKSTIEVTLIEEHLADHKWVRSSRDGRRLPELPR